MKKLVYLLIIALNSSLPGYIYTQAETITIENRATQHEALDDVVDAYLQDVLSGDIEMRQPVLEPVSRSEMVLRIVGGFLVMRGLTVYNFVQSCKIWVKAQWIAIKYKFQAPTPGM